MSNSSTVTPPTPTPVRGSQRKVLASGAVGQFIEFYDFGLYSVSAVTLSQVFFAPGDAWIGLMATFAAFGVAFLVRPFGGLFFGRLGDRYGRRLVLVITLTAIGLSTTFIGLLPGYATLGVAAPALLVLLRMIQGFSAGGESVGAPTFVMEHAPLNRRGFWLGITLAASSLPVVLASLFVLLLSQNMSPEAFRDWGWRIPFLVSLPLSLIGLWIRRSTEESQDFLDSKSPARPDETTPVVRERLDIRRMLQVMFTCGLIALGFYFASGYFVAFMQTSGGLSSAESLTITAIVLSILAICTPLSGLLGDVVGRRPMMIAGSAACAVLAVPCFMLLTGGTLLHGIAGQLLMGLSLIVFSGGAYTFFVEAFSTKVRFTSAAISYNIGYALFGGTAPLIGTWLVGATGSPLSPGFYAAAFSALVLAVVLFTGVPETHPLKQSSEKLKGAASSELHTAPIKEEA